MENGFKLSNIKRIDEFEFFDGLEDKKVCRSYDNWFSSLDFSVYRQSYIKINSKKIAIFSGNEKKLRESNFFNASTLDIISRKFNLSIIDYNGEKRCTCKGHISEEFYMIFYKNYYLIYSLGGSKSIESIYIHGLWKGV